MPASPAWNRARFVLTGPGGWLGQAFLDRMAHRLGPGWRRSVRVFGSRARRDIAPDGGELEVHALTDMVGSDVDGAVLIHLAFQGMERIHELSEADFVSANVRIDEAVSRSFEGGKPRAMFVSSSGMAREAATGANRNVYGLTKLMQEERFLTAGRRLDFKVLAGRVFNVAGPYANKLESYALTSFLMQGLRERRIQVKAAIPVFRSYLHVMDLADAVLAEVMDDDRSLAAAPMDLCGDLATEMADVALAAARALGLEAGAIERPSLQFGRASSYLGDPAPLKTLALKHGVALRSLDQQVRDTLDFLVRSGAAPADGA